MTILNRPAAQTAIVRDDAAPRSSLADVVLRRRRSPAVEWVDVDGEVVAWVAGQGSLHHLDAMGSLVFQLLDGATPLTGIVLDLGAAFGVEPALVEGDVCGFAATLLDSELVERVP